MIILKKLYLLGEFGLLFIGIPLAYYFDIIPGRPIPVLMVICAACVTYLLLDPSFDRNRLWNAQGVKGQLKRMGIVSLIGIPLMTALAWRLVRPAFFWLPLNQPSLWLLILVLYPLLSVYPQEIIYRAFFFHRYRPVFPSEQLMIAVSAISFGLVHIVFGNWIAVALSLFAGWMFAITYSRSKSLLAVWIEHAFYGGVIFTIGLGVFFFHGGAEVLEQISK